MSSGMHAGWMQMRSCSSYTYPSTLVSVTVPTYPTTTQNRHVTMQGRFNYAMPESSSMFFDVAQVTVVFGAEAGICLSFTPGYGVDHCSVRHAVLNNLDTCSTVSQWWKDGDMGSFAGVVRKVVVLLFPRISPAGDGLDQRPLHV